MERSKNLLPRKGIWLSKSAPYCNMSPHCITLTKELKVLCIGKGFPSSTFQILKAHMKPIG
jgi:hypothetical protein